MKYYLLMDRIHLKRQHNLHSPQKLEKKNEWITPYASLIAEALCQHLLAGSNCYLLKFEFKFKLKGNTIPLIFDVFKIIVFIHSDACYSEYTNPSVVFVALITKTDSLGE
jgi:hypothetical protein